MSMRTQLFINGEWTGAADGAEFTTSDPATGKELGVCAEAGPQDVDRAVDAARDALQDASWAAIPPSASFIVFQAYSIPI